MKQVEFVLGNPFPRGGIQHMLAQLKSLTIEGYQGRVKLYDPEDDGHLKMEFLDKKVGRNRKASGAGRK